MDKNTNSQQKNTNTIVKQKSKNTKPPLDNKLFQVKLIIIFQKFILYLWVYVQHFILSMVTMFILNCLLKDSVSKQKCNQIIIKFGLWLLSALQGISSCKICSFYQLVHSFFITILWRSLYVYHHIIRPIPI